MIKTSHRIEVSSLGTGRAFLPAMLRSALMLCIAALAFSLSSCGGGDSEGDKEAGSGGDIFELQDEVKDLLGDAKNAGMDKTAESDFERVEEQYDEADELLDEGKESKARTKLLMAKRKLNSFISAQGKIAEAIEKLTDLRKEVEDAKKKADAASASTIAASSYKQAADALKSAEEAIKKRESARAVSRARTQLDRAKTYFQQATEDAAENLKFKKRADEEKADLVKWKQRATEAGAEEKATVTWRDAVGVEKDAEDYLDRGEFRMALETFKEASRRYVMALEAVKQQDQLAKMQADNAKREQEYLANLQKQQAGGTQEAPIDIPPDPGLEGNPGDLAPPPGDMTPPGDFPDPVSVTSIEIFENFDATKYPHEIDAEDEAYLEMNFKKLVKSGMIEYDPQTGGVQIDYTDATNVKQDLIKVTPNTTVAYKSPFDTTSRGGRGRGGGGLMDPPGTGQQPATPFSFSGNTAGFVSFPVPFKYYVRVEYDMKIGTMDKTGTFTVAIMMNPKKGYNGFAAQWLRVGILQGGQPKVGNAPPPYTAVADRWFDKTRDVPMLVEFQMPDPNKSGDPLKSGRLSVTYDVDGDNTAVNAVSSARYKQGIVGFQWSRTKFEVKNLFITGILDKAEAVALLRAKLGDKKEKKTSSRGSAKSSKETATANKPTDSGKAAGELDF